MSAQQQILMPLLAMVALTAAVWLWMYYTRISGMRSQRIAPERLNTRAALSLLPEPALRAAENFKNLFEVPVLFYVAVLLLYFGTWVDLVFTGLAWAYVGLRIVHSGIHLTYNRVVHRFAVYVISCFILAAMWLRIGARILA